MRSSLQRRGPISSSTVLFYVFQEERIQQSAFPLRHVAWAAKVVVVVVVVVGVAAAVLQ